MELFASGESRWLGVQANVPGEREQPRVLLVSVPYALKAADAETLGGLPAAAFVRAIHAAPGLLSSTRGAAGKGELPGAALSDEPLTAAVTGDTDHLVKYINDVLGTGPAGLVEVGGNVGIGTTTPSAPLHLRSSLPTVRLEDSDTTIPDFSSTGFNPALSANTIGQLAFTSSGTGGMQFAGFSSAGANNGFPIVLVGYHGGTAPTTGAVQIFGFKHNGTTNRTALTGSEPVLAVLSGFSELLRVTGTGNVGVGTVSPGEKLDVVGNARASGNLTVDTSTLFVDATNDRVGVGTTTPTEKLEVAGKVKGTELCIGVDCRAVWPTGGGGTVTSLTEGTGIDLTPDTITTTGTIAMSAAALTRNITYLAGCDAAACSALVDDDDQRTIYVNLVGAMTINSVTCFSNAGTPSINLKRDVGGSTANILNASLVCESDNDGATSTNIAALEGVLGLNDKLDFVMVSAGGSAKRVTITVKATIQ